MKPRTILQREVVMLSNKHLNRISESQLKWGVEYCLEHVGFATKNKINCMDCGQSFLKESPRIKKTICPHCKTTLQIKQTKKRSMVQIEYLAITEVVKDFQVFRYFKIAPK
jgi:Zn finger protein HypA/HybF involved in hydrogenase expression